MNLSKIIKLTIAGTAFASALIALNYSPKSDAQIKYEFAKDKVERFFPQQFPNLDEDIKNSKIEGSFQKYNKINYLHAEREHYKNIINTYECD